MSASSDGLKMLAPDVHWDEEQGTIYLRQRGGSSPDIPKQVARSSDVAWSAKASQLLDLEFEP
jgi:hypothetical protein